MKLNFIFVTSFILISCLVPNVTSNLLDKLLSFLRISSPNNRTIESQQQQFQQQFQSNGRSSFISENDHKFAVSSPIANKFIIHLQDILSKKSVEIIENNIVNDDVDEEGDSTDSNNDLTVIQTIHGNENNDEHDSDLDDEDEDDDEEFTIKFHKKNNLPNGFKLEGNDLKIPPRSRLAESLLEALAQEIMRQSKEAKRKKSISKKQADQSSNNVNSTTTVDSNELDKIKLNQTTNHSKIKAFHSFNNSTNVTSYTYLGEHVAGDSNLLPKMMPSKLLGNTMDSIEKIFGKYTFLNLYSAPTINDTHNDRDLHQKGKDFVVLKANFVDYSNYSHTEKSTIVGEMPPVQNLTDLHFGNPRVKNNQSDDKRLIN